MILCVTGPMAAGKNVASDILAQKGFFTLDADLLVHQAVESQKSAILEAFAEEAKAMGLSLTRSDGSIDRRALGTIVFNNPQNVERQEAIVYPEINRRFEDFLQEHKGKDCVINATVLFKVPVMQQMDAVLYIDAPRLIRLVRIKKRDNLPLKNICKRFRAQKNLFSKYRLANADTRRVWNLGTRQHLEKKIEQFLASRR